MNGRVEREGGREREAQQKSVVILLSFMKGVAKQGDESVKANQRKHQLVFARSSYNGQ